jgi:hypothetical protein
MSNPRHSPVLGSEADRKRRRRPQLSCVLCRRRKVKCNRELPCDQCYKLSKGRSCVYADIIQSPGNSDQSILTLDPVDSNRNTLHRSPAESNTGVRSWREPHTSFENRHRQHGTGLENLHCTSSLATPRGSPVDCSSNAAARDESVHTPSSAPRQFDGVQLNGGSDSNLDFLGDGWTTEFHGNSHWWTVFPKVC